MAIDFKQIKYDKVGDGEEISDEYEEIKGELYLCLGQVIAELPRTKLLKYHFGIFGAQFGDYNMIRFDIRQLLNVDDIPLPLKVKARLAHVVKLLSKEFESDIVLLESILSLRK
jgi:hypothetical protein